MAVGVDVVKDFADTMSLGHMDADVFLVAVRCYAMCKEMLADYARKRFVHVQSER